MNSLTSGWAKFHLATAHLPAPPQRPGWASAGDGSVPAQGGVGRRRELLAELAKVGSAMAARFAEAADSLEARDLPCVFASVEPRLVHGDFAPWNVRMAAGRLCGLLDFDLAHVDVRRAVDIAMARRGYHDAVVRGYRRRASLTDADVATSLDALWLGGSLRGVWRVLESRLTEGRLTTHDWNIEQLGKTRPYRG